MNKLMIGFAVAVCAGCASDPDGEKTMSFLGNVATAVAVATTPPPPPPPPQTVIVAQPAIVQQPVVVAQPAIVQQPVVVAQPVVQQPVIQQPVIQQPVVQAPAVTPPAVQAPAVTPPAVQAPAVTPPAVQAPAVTPPAVQAPAVTPPAVQVPAVNIRTTATDTAEPEFKYGMMTFKKPATPEQIAAVLPKVTIKHDMIRLYFEGEADEATVAAAVKQFPQARSLRVKEVPITTTAMFAGMTNIDSLDLSSIKNLDLSGITDMKKLTSIDFTYSQIADLTPLTSLPLLKTVSLYGAEVKSFAPLAACAKLEKVFFYAVKTTPEGYASLGTLKQVKKFHGGLTKMTSLEWVRQVPQAEELQIFSEKIESFEPITALPNLTYLRCWNFNGGLMAPMLGDLSFIVNCKKLKRLELPGSSYTTTAPIAQLKELEEVDVSGAKTPVDMSFVSQLPKLKRLNVSNSTLVNGAAVNALPSTVRVTKDKKTVGL